MLRSAMGLVVVISSIFGTFVCQGFAGFFDELIEKGKERAKQEVDKEMQKIFKPDNQTAPRQPPTIPDSSKSIPINKTESVSATATIFGFVVPKVRTAGGKPMIEDPVTRVQSEEFRRYVDYTNPDSFESNAECYAANYLEQENLAKYLSEKTIDGIAKVRSAGSGTFATYPHMSFKAKFWKGSNEFETARARQAFIDENIAKFKTAVIPFPVQLAYVSPAALGQYNFGEGNFNLGFHLIDPQRNQIGITLRGLCGGERYFKAANPLPMSRRKTVSLVVGPAEAEHILKRTPNHQAYWGLMIEVTKSLGTSTSVDSVDMDRRSQGTPLAGQIISVGLYEDLALERPLHMFNGTASTVAQASQANEGKADSVTAQSTETANLSADVQISPPVMEELNGRPVLRDFFKVISGHSPTRKEMFLYQRLVDFIDLGTAKDLVENRASCFLGVHLGQPHLTTYGDPITQHTDLIMNFKVEKFGVINPIGDERIGGQAVTMPPQYVWKGNNEFDRKRSKQAFVDKYRSAFESAAIKLPLEIAVVDSLTIGEYDIAQKAFSIPSHPLSRESERLGFGICGGLNILSPTPFLEFSKWAINPSDAEKVIGRLPGRKAFRGTIMELSKYTGTSLQDYPYRKVAPGSTIDRSWTVITVKSVGLYEDPNLEKLLHSFEVIK